MPNLKAFCEESGNNNNSVSTLKALFSVMIVLQRYEFKTNHEEWFNSVKPRSGSQFSAAMTTNPENIKILYKVMSEMRNTFQNLLKIIHKRQVAIAKAQRNIPLAIECLNKYLEIFMADHDAWRELAEIYVSLQIYKQADFCYEELILSHPTVPLYHLAYADNVKEYLRRGTARESLFFYKEALQDFKHALVLEPQNKVANLAKKRLRKLAS